MSDIADKIYAATGLTLNAEAAAAIGQMIQQARRDGREEAALEIKQRGEFLAEGINHDAKIRADECKKIEADPARSGVPMNPELYGAHQLGTYVLIWRPSSRDYINHNGNLLLPEAACAWTYKDPCLTPAEVDVRVKQAKRDALRAENARADLGEKE